MEPLCNLAASTLSARLRLIFSVLKADTKEYPCSCLVRSECWASFLCPSQSLLAALFTKHFFSKISNWLLLRLWIGWKMSHTEHREKYIISQVSLMEWMNQAKLKRTRANVIKWKKRKKTPGNIAEEGRDLKNSNLFCNSLNCDQEVKVKIPRDYMTRTIWVSCTYNPSESHIQQVSLL